MVEIKAMKCLTADFPPELCQQDFKNDKEYLSTEMRQLLLNGKVNGTNEAGLG